MLKSWTDSPNHTLFATTPPGLEELCAQEWTEKGLVNPENLQLLHGGVEVVIEQDKVANLIRNAHIPTHLLWRLGSFRVRDFPKLYSKVKAMPWALILSSSELNYKVSSSNSRLIHTRRIEKTLRDGIESSLKARQAKKDLALRFENMPRESWPTVYARLENDIITLSLDLAGENLFKRGLKKNIGAAPLRENLASACLMKVVSDLRAKDLDPASLTLWDPFCGSGTFLIEAMTFNRPITSRDYALDIYDPFQETSRSKEKGLFKSYIASDKDTEMVKATDYNFKGIQEADAATAKASDVALAPVPEEDFVIVTNPPYGERIHNIEGLVSLYERLKTFKNCKGAYALIPPHLARNSDKGLLKLSHGGLSVALYRLELSA